MVTWTEELETRLANPQPRSQRQATWADTFRAWAVRSFWETFALGAILAATLAATLACSHR